MPIPWLTVLQAVPWGEVINRAPQVADGARKLWRAVARKPAAGEAPAGPAPVAHAADPPGQRLAALEASVDALQAQMLASSELIQALAEQNAQLIARVETLRRRLLGLGLLLGVGLLALLLPALRAGG